MTKVTGHASSPPTRPAHQTHAVAGPAGCANANVVPTAANIGAIDAATLCLINRARAAAGVAALTEDPKLDRASAAHSADMVAGNYFDHVGPDGLGPAERVAAAGYAGSRGVVAENLSAGTLSAATPAATVASWLANAAHRANILDPTVHFTGIGVVAAVPSMLGQQAGATYTEDFV